MIVTQRRKLLGSALWLAADAGGSSIISLLGALIGAVIIGRIAVGQSAIVLGIVQIVNFPVAALFADVLVQRKRLIRTETNSAFWLLVGISLLTTIILAGAAPFIAEAYKDPELEPMLIVGSISTLLTGLYSVQAALLRRAHRFRLLAIINLVSRSLGASTALLIAFLGLGAWSLVGQYVIATAATSIATIQFAGWRPRLPKEPLACRNFLRFAVLETMSQFIEDSRLRVFTPLAALSLSAGTIGEMALGFRIVTSLAGVIASAAGRLCLTVFARIQDNHVGLLASFQKASKVIGLLTLPLFAALAASAPDFIPAAFGKSWIAAVPIIQILSIAEGIYFCRSAARYLQTAKARPDISAYTGAMTLTLTIGLLLIRPPHHAFAAMMYWLIPTAIGAMVDIVLTSRLCDIGIPDQLLALLPGLAGGALMVCFIFGIHRALAQLNLAPMALITADAAASFAVGGLLVAIELLGIRRLLSAVRA